MPTVPTSRSPSGANRRARRELRRSPRRVGSACPGSATAPPAPGDSSPSRNHGALGDPRLRRHRLRAHVESEPRPAGLDPNDLGCLLADLRGAGRPQQLLETRGLIGAREQVDADVGGDRQHVGAIPLPEALGVLGPQALEPGELEGSRSDQRGDCPARSRPRPRRHADAVGAQMLDDARAGPARDRSRSHRSPDAEAACPTGGVPCGRAAPRRALLSLERPVSGELALQVPAASAPRTIRDVRSSPDKAPPLPQGAVPARRAQPASRSLGHGPIRHVSLGGPRALHSAKLSCLNSGFAFASIMWDGEAQQAKSPDRRRGGRGEHAAAAPARPASGTA